MMFSKACEYGIRATLYVASKAAANERVSLKDIAREIESPPAFTAKIMQQLARNGVVQSLKGPTGGFSIEKERVGDVRLIDVVEAIDGDRVFNGCGLGLKSCNAKFPCPIHDQFAAVRDGLKDMLERTSVIDIADSLERGATFLKR